MTHNTAQIDDAMHQMQSISADDPDMMAKLQEIAQKVAEAQGKKPLARNDTNTNVAVDPMDALGCEGCQ